MRMRQRADVAEAGKGVVLPASFGVLLLAPLFILIGVFFFGALLSLVVEIFSDGADAAKTLFADLLSKDLFQSVAIRTFRVSAIVTILTVLIGYAMAYAMWRSSPRARIIGLAFVMFPLFTSIVVRTYAWTTLFGRNGVINTTLLALGLIDAPIRMLNTEYVVFVGMVQVMLPFAILPIFTVLLSLDLDLMRASAVMGARPWTTFVNVVLPLTRQGAIVAGVIVFVMSLGFFITPAILGGPRSLMISNLISTEVNVFFDIKGGAAMALLLLIVTLGLLIAVSRVGSITAQFKRL